MAAWRRGLVSDVVHYRNWAANLAREDYKALLLGTLVARLIGSEVHAILEKGLQGATASVNVKLGTISWQCLAQHQKESKPATREPQNGMC